MKRLAVYCGSATPADPVYIETARTSGRTLAERGIGVVYGGGRLGPDGRGRRCALAAGGEVIGVIPEALVDAEVAHRGLHRAARRAQTCTSASAVHRPVATGS